LVYGLDGHKALTQLSPPANVFTVDVDALIDPARVVSAFSAPGMMATLVFAEKGSNSTSNVMPSQQHYRSAAEWETYRRNLVPIKSNTRPHLARTNGNLDYFDVRGGHLFMDHMFTARDPTTAILDMKLRSGAAVS
jgi:hypothetical protein